MSRPSGGRPGSRFAAVTLLILTVVLGCRSTTSPDPGIEPGIRIVGSVFELRAFPDSGPPRGFQTEIPYKFTNRTEERVHVDRNCHEEIDVRLERKVGGQWQEVWTQLMDTCGHQDGPIVVEPGAEYSATVHIFGFPPGSLIAPELDAREGTHRIRWEGALNSSGEPIPLERRVSNEFGLAFE